MGCPKCGSSNVSRVREDYISMNDQNPVECECRNCGHTWTEWD